MPLAVKINVAMRELNCQKIGSERVKAEVKICRLRIVKIEKILTVTYRTLLPKTTNFLKNGG